MATPQPPQQPQAAPNPLSIVLPAAPQDPRLHLPPPPHHPPSEDDILRAVRYRHAVEASMNHRPDNGPIEVRCSQHDRCGAIVYEHAVITQAHNAASVAPPWFHQAHQELRTDIMERSLERVQELIMNAFNGLRDEVQQARNEVQQLRAEVRTEVIPRLNRLFNLSRDGGIRSLAIIPFTNGLYPPAGLPRLDSVDAIDQLNSAQLTSYLIGYGVDPIPNNPSRTIARNMQREALKVMVGALQ
ncbi:hypothetical protein EDB85DRAFT_2067411 [Lactarius pseudohatsudake]|nr:hypothetical protein EDB85DRAFT_2067411 [Lactarius pseudohatsudake]